jgi:serine/threonine-protein kinase
LLHLRFEEWLHKSNVRRVRRRFADVRFCSFCAHEVGRLSQLPTAAPAVAPAIARHISSDSIPVGGFTPGMIVADRYRIIGLLGRGGMGEVYRADDLKLGQPVALKFLPKSLASDPVRRERFFAEVRITRQLAHPNICRVYDIAEVDGQHFLSMEYIDGEDLASLIKRIGYLSNEKALDILRQLIFGLLAAPEKGVLHRDLKPANIMIDGHGRVRITDFGLAIAAAEEESDAAEILGTPAYMAPEQFAGKGATTRSDVYSLGLVFYEVCTGKRAFTGTTVAELRQQKEGPAPRAPSEIRQGIDPVVERLILRCIERDPRARPASVAQLAMALPGGDPLAAAIAAGETPSPELVAASGSKEGLRPAIAVAVLVWVIVGSVLGVWLGERDLKRRNVQNGKTAVVPDRARQGFLKEGRISRGY